MGVEKEVVSGMEKAKEEVKKDMGRDMKEREERSLNVVFYGIEESKEVQLLRDDKICLGQKIMPITCRSVT